jgi:hypothetical protein
MPQSARRPGLEVGQIDLGPVFAAQGGDDGDGGVVYGDEEDGLVEASAVVGGADAGAATLKPVKGGDQHAGQGHRGGIPGGKKHNWCSVEMMACAAAGPNTCAPRHPLHVLPSFLEFIIDDMVVTSDRMIWRALFTWP